MGEMGLGADSYLRVQKETTYGTGVTGAMTLLPVKEGTDLIHNVQNIENANLISSRTKQAPDLGRKVSSGSIIMDMHPSLMGTLFNFIFGAASSAAGVSSTYIHTWLQELTAIRDGAIFTTMLRRGTELEEQFTSCMVSKFIIEANNEGNTLITCEVFAKDRATDKPVITSFSYPSLIPFKFCHLVVSEAGLGTIYPDNVTLEIDMNYDLERFKMGDCTPQRPLFKGIPMVNMKMTVDADQQFIDAAIAHTAYDFTLTWTNTELAGGAVPYSLVFELPACRINPETSVPLSPERLKMDLELDCSYGGATTGSGADSVQFEARVYDATATYTA